MSILKPSGDFQKFGIPTNAVTSTMQSIFKIGLKDAWKTFLSTPSMVAENLGHAKSMRLGLGNGFHSS